VRKYVVSEPVFFSEIILMEGTAEDYKRMLRRTFKNVPAKAFDIDDADGACEAFFKKNDSFAAIIWVKNWKNDPDHEWTLNHECTHAMHFLLQYRELYYDMVHDELASYYHSWLYTECLKRLRKGRR
jgi:hypothetical protein